VLSMLGLEVEGISAFEERLREVGFWKY
jgi:hypothetical protein